MPRLTITTTSLLTFATAVATTAVQANPSAMNQDTPTGFTYRVLQPAGRDFLTSRVLVHQDFQTVDLPEEKIDFEDPTKSLPLLVAATQYGPMVFAVATRPAYGDGATSQWLEFLLRKDDFAIGEIRRTSVGIYPAVTCDARQTADGVTMRSRMVLLEDGGRMVTMSAMAPEELWSAVEARFTTMLESFEFQVDHGPKAPLFPGEAVPVRAATTRPAAAPASVASEATASPPDAAASADAAPSSPAAKLSPEEFAQLVLADDATSFDQEVGINANLRNRGVGFVPRVLSLDAEEKSARLGAGAIEAIIRLPYGWHALDDGRRTLVFDGENRMQINLNLRRQDGRAPAELARSLLTPYLEREPQLPTAVLEFEGGIAGAGVQGANIDGEKLDQVFLVREAVRDGYALVARVTASGEDSVRALNLAGDILATLELPAEVAARR